MKKLTLIVLAFFVSLISTYGQETEKSLLWEISGNGLEQSSYLYGTFHLVCRGDIQLKDKAEKAFNKSEQLVLELDFGDRTIMKNIRQNMFFTDGSTAKDYLNDEEYKLAKSFFNDSLDQPFQYMKVVKPFFLSSMTLRHFTGCGPKSFEKHLAYKARKDSIEIQEMETVQEYLGFIDEIPVKKHKKILIEPLKKYDKTKKMFAQMIEHYRNEDISKINSLTDEYMSEEYAESKKDLLTSRNKNWVPDIEKLMKQKPSFIAIGAGHLPGDGGIIELLREKGYTVEVVK